MAHNNTSFDLPDYVRKAHTFFSTLDDVTICQAVGLPHEQFYKIGNEIWYIATELLRLPETMLIDIYFFIIQQRAKRHSFLVRRPEMIQAFSDDTISPEVLTGFCERMEQLRDYLLNNGKKKN